MTKHIAVIRGDGIGPEIVREAIAVLDTVADRFGHTFVYTDVDMGGCAIDKFGEPLPASELQKCLESDSVLLVRSAETNGIRCRGICARKKACSRCAQGWAFTATTVLPRSGRSLPTHRR